MRNSFECIINIFMRVQASSFRLPVLRLQPRESSKHLSQEPYEQSSSSIKYNSSPLRDAAPIQKRVRGMTIAIYNSQDKLKTSEYRYNNQPSEFITQQNVHNSNSMSVQNTVRRYRSKLKSMMFQQPEELSRDPRIYSFKEPAATIRLTRLTDQEKPKESPEAFKERIRLLMGKIQMLLQSQSFYSAPQAKESFSVTMVRLKDEYDCLFEDFNDFYISRKKLDQQVLSLLNHMEIIKRLLKPPPPEPRKPPTVTPFHVDNLLDPPPQEKPQPEPIQQELTPIHIETQPSRKPSSVIYQEAAPTPISSSVFRGEETQSELSGDEEGFSPSGQKRRKSKLKVDRTPKENDGLQLQQIPVSPMKVQRSNYGDYEDDEERTQHSFRLNSNRTSNKNSLSRQPSLREEAQTAEQAQQEMDSPTKPPLRRTTSNLGGVNKRRSTVINMNESSKSPIKKRKSGARTISERDDSQLDSEQSKLESLKEEDIEEKSPRVEFPALLEKLAGVENIYDIVLYQTWDYHIDRILEGREFGEFDL